ncbi:hypothetical protein [Streptomyces sp. NBC_00370]|uniref:hypothetical protein n=1 Tax=Streptomyces sp. NBC_00370 TaxID=2975728 RepID=UPI002E253BB9
MSKHKKGRKHRTVNRTPRPVGPAAGRRAATPTAKGLIPPPAHTATSEPQGPGEPAAQEEPAGPVFYNSARNGGLGLHAAKTWRELNTAGASGVSVDELSAAAGYQAPTITKHLKGLARYGLAEQNGDRWQPTGRSQWEAAAQHGLPVRAGDEALVGG